jgi:multiple sugar transport system permease protein
MTRALRTAAPTVALALLSLVAMVPLVWMVSVSLMRPGASAVLPAPLLPAVPTLANYRALFGDYAIAGPLLNSIAISTIATLAGLTLMVPAGYAFAKLRFAGRGMLLSVIAALLVVPSQVAMLPLFLMLKSVGLVNSYAGAVVPWLAGLYGILFVRQAALSIPDDMLDAARLDGATETQILRLVALPLLRPIIATLALATFLGVWNDFLWPLIILTDDRLYTLPVALASLSREHAQDTELMMAGSVVTVLPVLLLYFLLQRHYVAGVLGGSIKG